MLHKRKLYHILAGKIFDSHTRKLIPNQVITVDRDQGIILDVQDASTWDGNRTIEDEFQDEIIDLGHLTILPGFVDAHVHFFLHSYEETSWNDQLTKESLTERSLRAGVHARKTLMAGFTTVRDLGTEGAEDADIALRKCLAILPNGTEPLIPGPRYYCANRAIVCTGSYGPKSTLYPSENNIEGITGAIAVDGVDDCIREVRRQVGAGADWIKIYGDYKVRSRITDVSSEIAGTSLPTFNNAELKAMIDTAHELGVKIAVHANNPDVIDRLLDLGPDSIEHGAKLFNTTIERWAKYGGKTIWVPTLAAFHHIAGLGLLGMAENWEDVKRAFKKVLEIGGGGGSGPGGKGIQIACGGDTGAFAHGKNGMEMVLMRRLGASWENVLSWATLGGWECVRGMEWEGAGGKDKVKAAEKCTKTIKGNRKSRLERAVPFGAIRNGWVGDLVGIEGSLDGDEAEFEQAIMQGVKFVMKGGSVYKRDGNEVL